MTNLFNKAKRFAIKKHQGQIYENQPFVIHPLQTAQILQQVTSDANLICAGILHDTLEDTETTYDELVKEFNADIADLVLEVTKEGSNYFPHLKTQRGIMLKFADRLSNLSHMSDWSDKKKNWYLKQSQFWKS